MIKCLFFLTLLTWCCGVTPVLRSNEHKYDLQRIHLPVDFRNKLKLEADLDNELELNKLRQFERSNIYPLHKYKLPCDEDADEEVDNSPATQLQRPPAVHSNIFQDYPNFLGTNLCEVNNNREYTSEEVALLSARKDFEMLIPTALPQTPLSDDEIVSLIECFHQDSLRLANKEVKHSPRIVEKAFYDTLGGFLRSYIVPVAKFSFYAGQVHLETVQNVIGLYEQCKVILNTNGNGWRTISLDRLTELIVLPTSHIRIYTRDFDDESSCCADLDLCSSEDKAKSEKMIVPLPKLDPEDCEGELGNIWLPFKQKHTYDLTLPSSAYIVLKFYQTVSGCYKSKHMSQDTYDNNFMEWILQYVHPHLTDEQFYPGFGAILTIYENLRRGKKEIAMDDTEESDEDCDDESDDNESNFGINARSSANRRSTRKRNEHNHSKHHGKTKKPKCKPKTKPKHRDKCAGGGKNGHNHKNSKNNHNTPNSKARTLLGPFLHYFKDSKQKKFLHYFAYFLIAVVLLLLLLLMCLVISKRKRKQAKPSPKTTPPPKKRCCERFFKKQKKKKHADEEILIKPDSKSIISTKTPAARSSTSSSSLACHPKSKCIPCPGMSKKSGAAVIETTSMGYSSTSEASSAAKKQKAKAKVVTINEKKGSSKTKGKTSGPDTSSDKKGAKSNSADPKTPNSPAKASSTGQSNTSWETMYDT